MKRIVAIVFASAVLALTLAACSGGQSQQASSSASTAQSSAASAAASTTQSSAAASTQQESTTAATTSASHSGQGPRSGMAGAGGMTSNSDAQQAVIDANSSKFQLFTFVDEQTGATLEYCLFVPEGASAGSELPLVMYMPDSTGAGIGAQAIVQRYYGANVWVADESQAKHPAFVLVPAFTGTATSDNWEVSDEVEMTLRLIESLEGQYPIDKARVYTTGQSMGCMASLYLNSVRPDFFAASVFVSGQWDVSVLKCLETQKFFYIVAGGDEKASGGQDEVKAMFDADNVAYAYAEWNAQDDEATQEAAVQALLDEGHDANMIRFEAGSVLNGQGGMEHMASFNYAYQLASVRDWLFEQSL